MKSGTLYLSFWHISLENLPAGQIRHTILTPVRAKQAIRKAQRNESLMCVSQDDLLAPYRKRELENHSQLCAALNKKFGIKLTIADFIDALEDEEGSLNIINPLCFAKVRGRDRLIVVTCMYELPKKKRRDRLAMDVSLSTIEFHLFEAATRVNPRLASVRKQR